MEINNANQIDNQAPATVKVTPQEFAAKYQGKKECWRFVATDCGGYLPEYESVTIFHLRDLTAGKRKMIKATDAKHITVPQFEGLKIETMLDFAKDYPQVALALPECEREIYKLPRQYIANVIFTLVGEPFETWVNGLVNARHKRVEEEEGMIEMDPEIHAIYMKSKAVSVLNGNSHNLMKSKQSSEPDFHNLIFLYCL